MPNQNRTPEKLNGIGTKILRIEEEKTEETYSDFIDLLGKAINSRTAR